MGIKIRYFCKDVTPFKIGLNKQYEPYMSISGIELREGFDLSVIILASLLVFPMLDCRYSLLRL